MALIELGALDEADVETFAQRVGVGERQLRRLFRRHLGASPIAVAQTRRVLLAKQLIHETRLPMSEIALAAGFGSIRRFNETFQQLFGCAPGALRRNNAAE
ncbi:MAG TPA: helix-turn-helix domain-containing protein, partial [Methylocella sp.]|nr:helix-turn-helix domain-containing protein [Methylocella sp.]